MGKQVGEGYAFPRKACFVCGSLSHLIKDCNFHEKRLAQEQAMPKQTEKTNGMGNSNGRRDKMPIWNNTQRVNHTNKFVPRAILLPSGIVELSSTSLNLSTPVPTGRQNLSKPVPAGRQNCTTPVPTGRQNLSKPVPAGRQNCTTPVPTGRQNCPIPVTSGRQNCPNPVTSGRPNNTV
ncbi:hypothetical protein Tco_1200004, partial [Tanacetum coccineum]